MTRTRAIETPSTLPRTCAGGVSSPPPVRRRPGGADPVKCRTRIGYFDETGNADAAMNVPFAQRRLFGAQRVVIHHLHKLIHRTVMRQFFEPQARGRGARVAIVG